MAPETIPLTDEEIPLGTYSPSKPTDLRSPCPMVNCLANHGFLPRDGRNMTPVDLQRGFHEAGFSWFLGKVATKVIMTNRVKDKPATTFFSKIWAKITAPLAFILKFCMHIQGQIDPATGKPSIHLNQMADPGLIEHDVSLSRHDRAQGDNLSRQPKLIDDLLACSSDGGKTISIADIGAYRLRRIQDQKEINPKAVYTAFQHKLACGEISLLMNCLGDGKSVRCDYVKAFFEEERLPYKEGWKKRSSWWQKIGLVQVTKTTTLANKTMGLNL